jgi:anti-sigma regulatory factor (Ser/Thr protein kinase)
MRRQAAVLGTLTIPGRAVNVGDARAFVARSLGSGYPGSDEATLLTSELVTNAVLHSNSGLSGGTVTIVVIEVPDGILVEVIDDGAAGAPVVKSDLFAAEGHGLFLVQQLAAQWGYLRDRAGTTVWFRLDSRRDTMPRAECRGKPADGRGTDDDIARMTRISRTPWRPAAHAGNVS